MVASSSALVGRDRELSTLLRAFADVRSGRGRRVLVSGPDGCGAPALVWGLRDELGRRAIAHRWVWAARGLTGDSAYAALAGLLPRSTGRTDDSGGDLRGGIRPARLEDLLAGLTAVPVDARPSVVGERLARALAPAVGDPPLVLAIERVDALDPLAAAALATTMRILASTPALTVATTQSSVEWPAEQVLSLGPLAAADAQLLAGKVAGDDPRRIATLIDLSGGLPGHMVALSRWPDPRVPAAEQLAALHPGAAALVFVAGLAEGSLPSAELIAAAGVDHVLLARLEERGVLRRSAPVPADSTSDGRDAAEPMGWTVPGPWARVAASATPLDGQRELAAMTARALDRVGAPARVRARALEHAGSHGIVGAWQAAADEAGLDEDVRATCLLKAWRALIAEGGLRRGPGMTSGSPRPDLDSEPALRCADALLAVGRTDEALDVIAAGLLRVPRRSRVSRARLLACQHRALLHLGEHTLAAAALAEATGLLPEDAAPADQETARALAEVMTLTSMAQVIDDPALAAVSARRACRGAELTDDPAIRAAALGALALARGLADEPGSDPVDALFDAALELSDDSGDRALEVRIAANRVYIQWRAGDLVGMEASVAGELARLERSGLAEAAGGQLLVARAVALHGLGRWGSLADHLEATLARRERLGAQVELLLRLVAIELAADLGRVAEARAGLADLEAHPAYADPEVSYEVMAVRLGIATIAGDLPRGAAGALVDEAVVLAGRIVGDPFAAARVRVAGLRLLATATQRAGGPLGVAGAPGHESAAGPDPGRSSDGQDGPAELRALHAEEHAWRCGEGWAAAIAAWDALPMPHRRAWAQVWAAHAAARDGRVPAALQLADTARGTAEALGAVPLGQAAERLLRQLGRRSGRTEGALTSRERDVLAEVARGQTNREIGRALGMSERTVAVHLSRIFAKLGAGTRGEAVLVARHLGEIL